MWDKHHYFVYGEVLDFYLQQGIEMTHLYCGIVFNVKEWLKPYVDMNTELRNKCKEEGQAIGTIVYKLMNNAIYGKFLLQNVMKQSRALSSLSTHCWLPFKSRCSHCLAL